MAKPPSQPLSSLIYRSLPYRRLLERQPASEVRAPFPLPIVGDAEAGQAIVDGTFIFHGRRFPLGRMPWSVLPPGELLAAALHGFSWLTDLQAVGDGTARQRARDLVLGWIEINRRWTGSAWAPPVLARRLISWLAASEFLLSGADPKQRADILAAATAQARHLRRIAGRSADTPAGMPVAVALVALAVCLGLDDADRAVAALQDALVRQLYRDGGVRQRSPSEQLTALCDLLGVRAALDGAGRRRSPLLDEAIERMARWLRLMRHGDGALSLFNGGKEEDRRAIDVVLAASGGGGVPASASGTGYERLTAGRSCLIVDCGGPPPAAWSASAHAAPLAFELSHGRQRLIVNCGSFAGDDERWQRALRSTAAHSTLGVDDENAVAIGADGRLDAHGIRVTAVRREEDGATWLDTSHDGYRRNARLVHRRRLYLGAEGNDVRGEDTLDGKGEGHRFALRFHLHPEISAEVGEAGVRLSSPSGGLWQFVAVGGPVTLEDSVYFGRSDKPLASRQIVVADTLKGKNAVVKWALHREEEG